MWHRAPRPPGPCLPPPSLLASSRSQPPSSATSLSACVFLPRRSLSCLLLSRSCSLPRPRVSSFKLAPALFQTTLSSGPPVTPMVPLQVWEERFPPGATAEAAPIVQVVFEPAPPLAECQECWGGGVRCPGRALRHPSHLLLQRWLPPSERSKAFLCVPGTQLRKWPGGSLSTNIYLRRKRARGTERG